MQQLRSSLVSRRTGKSNWETGPPVMGTGGRKRQYSYQRILMGLALCQGDSDRRKRVVGEERSDLHKIVTGRKVVAALEDD